MGKPEPFKQTTTRVIVGPYCALKKFYAFGARSALCVAKQRFCVPFAFMSLCNREVRNLRLIPLNFL